MLPTASNFDQEKCRDRRDVRQIFRTTKSFLNTAHTDSEEHSGGHMKPETQVPVRSLARSRKGGSRGPKTNSGLPCGPSHRSTRHTSQCRAFTPAKTCLTNSLPNWRVPRVFEAGFLFSHKTEGAPLLALFARGGQDAAESKRC